MTDRPFDPFDAIRTAPARPWSYRAATRSQMTRTWLLADLWVWLVGPWRRQNDHDELTVSMLARLNHLENRMSLTDAALAELDAATNEVAADLDALEAQIAGLDADAASKISAAAARLRGLAADPEQPVPPAEPADPAPADPEAPADPSDETPPAA